MSESTRRVPGQGDDWDKEQVEGEGQDDIPHDHAPKPDQATHWNKQQWEGEGQDDTPLEQHPRTEAGLGEGDSELSGHGENPGGGKRWANVDEA